MTVWPINSTNHSDCPETYFQGKRWSRHQRFSALQKQGHRWIPPREMAVRNHSKTAMLPGELEYLLKPITQAKFLQSSTLPVKDTTPCMQDALWPISMWSTQQAVGLARGGNRRPNHKDCEAAQLRSDGSWGPSFEGTMTLSGNEVTQPQAQYLTSNWLHMWGGKSAGNNHEVPFCAVVI